MEKEYLARESGFKNGLDDYQEHIEENKYLLKILRKDGLVIGVNKRLLESMYLQWINNFASVAEFAEYYEITKVSAFDIIRTYNEHFGEKTC